jgi:hypothetical protein
MTDLRQAAQQALEAWDSPLWKTGTTAAAIADLRAALEQQAEPVACGYDETTGNCTRELCCRSTQLEQQAEPVAWMRPSKDGYDSAFRDHSTVVMCTGNPWTGWVPLYTAPTQREWDKPNASFNDWWNGDYDDSANPFEQDSAAYWAWAGWQAAHRQWVGLTDEEVNRESAPIAQQMKLAFHAGMYVAQKILKERNNG